MVTSNGFDAPKPGRSVRLHAALALLASIAVVGCSGLKTRQSDVTEIQLRQQRLEAEQLRGELDTARARLAEQRRRIASQQTSEVGSVSRVTQASTSAALRTSIERLRLNSLLSGGLDRDGVAGDELLSVLATPIDGTGAAVREDGTLTVTAFDYALPDGQQQVGYWKWTSEDVAELWQDGLVGTGYRVTEKWLRQPQSRQIVLHARFVTVDQRQFDATETITIDVIPVDAELSAAR